MIRPVVPNLSALLGRSIIRERSLDALILTSIPLIIVGLIIIYLALAAGVRFDRNDSGRDHGPARQTETRFG